MSWIVAPCALECRKFLLHSLPVDQDLPDQPADFLRQQAEARFGFGTTLLETCRVGRPRFGQTRTRKAQVDQLPTQIVERTERHVRHAHLRQSRQILLEILELVTELQHVEPQKPLRMRFPGFFQSIEHAQRHTVAVIRQAGVAKYHLPAADIDLHQLGQLAETPVGHARVFGRRFMQFGEFLPGLAAPLAAQLGQTAAQAELALMLINQPEVETEMRRQCVGTERVRRDFPAARVEPARLQDEMNQRRNQRLVGRRHGLDKFGGKLRHRHQLRADLLRQRLDELDDLFLEQARHQPFAARPPESG